MKLHYFYGPVHSLVVALSISLAPGCGEVDASKMDPNRVHDHQALFDLVGGIRITVDAKSSSGSNYSGSLPPAFNLNNYTRTTSGTWCAWSHGCGPTASNRPIPCSDVNPPCSVSSGTLNCRITDNPHTDNSGSCVVTLTPKSSTPPRPPVNPPKPPVNPPKPPLNIEKTTSFTPTMRAFIEGHKLNCTKFADTIGTRFAFVFTDRKWQLANAFCLATAASFRETENSSGPRLLENYKMSAVCASTDGGKTWKIKSSKIDVKPGCFMGAETLGPPSAGIVVGNGVLGNCIANASGSTFNSFTDGSPPQHLDLGLQIVKNRVCTAIKVGMKGSFGCRSDGVATLSAQTEGTNFPSLAWSITRIDPTGKMDSTKKVDSQTRLDSLWDCPGGNMRSGTKGRIELK